MTNANPDDPRFYHRIKDHTSLRVFEGLIRVIINEPRQIIVTNRTYVRLHGYAKEKAYLAHR